MYTCEADLEKASSALESHRHEVKERDNKLHRLSSELRARAAECERLQKIIGQQQHSQERMRQEAELRMYSLRVRTYIGLASDYVNTNYSAHAWAQNTVRNGNGSEDKSSNNIRIS